MSNECDKPLYDASGHRVGCGDKLEGFIPSGVPIFDKQGRLEGYSFAGGISAFPVPDSVSQGSPNEWPTEDPFGWGCGFLIAFICIAAAVNFTKDDVIPWFRSLFTSPVKVTSEMCPIPHDCITSPETGSVAGERVVFTGTATKPNFELYNLEVKSDSEAENFWKVVAQAGEPVSNGSLGEWITVGTPPGIYDVRLVVIDYKGEHWPEMGQVKLQVK